MERLLPTLLLFTPFKLYADTVQGSIEEYRLDIDQKLAEFLAQDSIFNLPIHNRTVRPSKCPNVNEEEVIYRFDCPDLNNKITSVFLPVVTVDDKIVEGHWNLPDRPWIKGILRIRPHLNCMDQENEDLVNIIKKDYIIPPDDLPYNFSAPLELGGEWDLPLEIDRMVFGESIKDGFFVEAGSQDAETTSNTLHFEIKHGWTGLLIEPHPLFFADGLYKHRNVTSVQTCLATTPNPSNMDFDLFGTLREEGTRKAVSMAGLVNTPGPDTVTMQCLPLYSLLQVSCLHSKQCLVKLIIYNESYENGWNN